MIRIIDNWDQVNQEIEGDYSQIDQVNHNLRKIEDTDFCEDNRVKLREHLRMVKDCQCILEIGVENNPDKKLTSTNIFLSEKPNYTYYFGVDLLDRKHLDNVENKVYTIKENSLNIPVIMSLVRKYVNEIDFLFIDGWHSIDQIKREFKEYSPYLSKDAIIGVHDTNYHLGPRWLMATVDRNLWHVVTYPGDTKKDFGIGFLWKK